LPSRLNVSLYSSLIRPLLFRLDPETAHNVAIAVLSWGWPASLVAADTSAADGVELWNLKFRNRLGIAAGLDKNAVAIDAWFRLGFGFCELGTITAHAQPGNPKPRITRLIEAEALINRMGFPNDGAQKIADRLDGDARRRARKDFPVGINIGKSKITPIENAAEDYLGSFKALHDDGDYFVVNVSSPNTPGLRDLQDPVRLAEILHVLRHYNVAHGTKPVLVKLAPDIQTHDLGELVGALVDAGVDGIVATNTTLDHGKYAGRAEGGLSGRPLRNRADEMIRFISDETSGRLPIIGVGGVLTRDDYQRKLDAGATLVQVYTGLVYRGPELIAEILG
jgi:dihydroorotate dehydrogenase